MPSISLRKNKSGVNTYQLRWRDVFGKSKTKSLGAITKREAERILRHKSAELLYPEVQVLSPTLKEFFFGSDEAAGYRDWYELHHSQSSFDRMHGIAINTLLPQFGDDRLADIDAGMITDLEVVRRKKVSSGTWLKELNTIKAILNAAIEWNRPGMPTTSPIKGVKKPKQTADERVKYFTAAQLELLYEIEPPSRAAAWKLMANTGMRRGEAMNLDLEKSLNMEQGILTIISRPDARTKSGKSRTVPLFQGAEDAAKELLKLDKHKIFPDNPKPQALSKAFQRTIAKANSIIVAEKLNIDLLEGSMHTLRHCFCSHLAMSGQVSLREIQEWAGHENMKTTEIYSHLIKGYNNPKKDLLTL